MAHCPPHSFLTYLGLRTWPQVARGVASLHRHGLLHGDVKLANFLVRRTPQGRLEALVSDLGSVVPQPRFSSEVAVVK